MSDPTGVLVPALKAWLEADAGVIAAFGPKPVKVFDDQPPANERYPYIWIALADPEDVLAECYGAADVFMQIDIWSLTSPPGKTEARRIGAAVNASLAALAADPDALAMANQRLVAVIVRDARYLTDRSDGKTVHGIVSAELSVEPTD